MNSELERLTANWQRRPGADLEVIRERESALGIRFPDDYVDFMVGSNGAFGGNERISIEIDRIEVMAPGDLPLPGLPGLFRFGGDGASETFAFDVRGENLSLVMVGEGADPEDTLWQGETFTEFLRNVPLYDSR